MASRKLLYALLVAGGTIALALGLSPEESATTTRVGRSDPSQVNVGVGQAVSSESPRNGPAMRTENTLQKQKDKDKAREKEKSKDKPKGKEDKLKRVDTQQATSSQPARAALSMVDAVRAAETLGQGEVIKIERRDKPKVIFRADVQRTDGTITRVELSADGKLLTRHEHEDDE